MSDMKSTQIKHLMSMKAALEQKEKDHLKDLDDTQCQIWQKQIESTIFKDSTIGSSDPNKNTTIANKLDEEVVKLKEKLNKLYKLNQ